MAHDRAFRFELRQHFSHGVAGNGKALGECALGRKFSAGRRGMCAIENKAPDKLGAVARLDAVRHLMCFFTPC